MTPQQLRTLRWFAAGERRQDGALVDWESADYWVFFWLDVLRGQLGTTTTERCVILRETHLARRGKLHDWDRTAVDCTFPGVPLWRVFDLLCRMPHLSWGLYSGHSVHMDRRLYDEAHGELPARWLAVKPEEMPELEARGLADGVAQRTATWHYLAWRHAKIGDLLAVVFELAERQRTGG